MRATSTAASAAPLHAGRLPVAAALAAVAAAVLNAGVFAAAVAAGVFPSLARVPDAGAQMSLGPVVFVSALGAAAGVGTYALVRRFAREPLGTFLRIAGVVLVLSFAAPFAIPGTTLAQALVLNGMHAVAAAVVVAAVWRTARG